MSADILKVLSPMQIEAINELIEAKLREQKAPDVPTDRFLSVAEAAQVSGHPPGTIRTWMYRGTIKNYGRRRSPRVLLSEILNLDGGS
jgi:hypothetical protein